MRKRTIAFLGLNLLVCASLLTACGKDEAEQTPSDVPTVVPTEPGDNPSVPQPTPTEPGTVVPTNPQTEGYTIEIGGVATTLLENSQTPENFVAEYVAKNINVTANSAVVVKKDGKVISNIILDSGDNNLMISGSGYVIQVDAIADIHLKLWEDGNYSLLITFEPTVTGYFENYVLDESRTYTGYLVDGLPEGEGTLEWVKTNCVYVGNFKKGLYDGEGTFYWNELGNKLVATFENGNPTVGEYTYVNTMRYIGEFNSNWEFHGQGTFDWSTYNADGSVKAYGWLYEGEFKNGTIIGCVGKVTFTTHRDGSNGEGLLWFEGEMDGFPNIKKGQQGKGSIRYSDKSVYEGDLTYSQSGEWLRIGNGSLDFSDSEYIANGYGGTTQEMLLRYEGQFDANKTGWIFGNGVIYYTDKSGNPVSYVKGYFNGLAPIKPYEGDEITLYEGFDESMEKEYIFNYSYMENYINNKYPQTVEYQTIICGDSYTDMMHASFGIMDFDVAFKDYDVIDTGIGGTNFYEWQTLAKYLIIPYSPEKLVLHLGYNDLHMGLTAEETLREADKLIKQLKTALPELEIFLMTVEPSPTFTSYFEEETKYNNLLKAYCADNNINLIDHGALLLKDGRPVGDLWNYFISDGVHLNSVGYARFVDMIKEAVFGEDIETPVIPEPVVEYVTDYMLDDSRKYTGTLVNGLPEGEGTLTWVNTNCVYQGQFSNGVYHGEGVFQWLNHNNKVEGTFAYGEIAYGKFTYANTMSYTGEFKNWEFHGQGTFDWNTYNADGSIKSYGWLYEGEFKNGTIAGCIGRVTFIRNNPNASGIHWFEGLMDGFPSIAKNQTGIGKIIYGDGTSYEGEIYYSQSGEWLRMGQGVQDFTSMDFPTTYLVTSTGGSVVSTVYQVEYYVGAFDSISHSWIYGNGVYFLVDATGKPAGYLLGYWNGFTLVKDYEGTFDESTLLEAWKGTSRLN